METESIATGTLKMGPPFTARKQRNEKNVNSDYGKGHFKVSKYSSDHVISIQSPNIEDLNNPPALSLSQSKLFSIPSFLFSCPCPFIHASLRI